MSSKSPPVQHYITEEFPTDLFAKPTLIETMRQLECPDQVLQTCKAMRKGQMGSLARFIYRTALHTAIGMNDKETAQKLAEQTSGWNLTNYNLAFLAKDHGTEALELLKTLELFSKPDDIAVVLFLADLRNEKEVEYARRNIPVPEGWQIGSDHEVAIRWLREHTADDAWNDNIQTIICFAAENGQTKIVEGLIKQNPKVDCRNALSYALSSGQTDVVKILIENGVDPDEPICWPPSLVCNKSSDRQSWDITPLAYASVTGHIALIRLLLEKGADVNFKNRHGVTTFFDYTCSLNPDPMVVQILMDGGAIVNKTDDDGFTALMCATDPQVVRILSSNESSLYFRDEDGESPLIHQAGNPEALQILLPCYTKECLAFHKAFWRAISVCNPRGALVLMEYCANIGLELDIGKKEGEYKRFRELVILSLRFLVRYDPINDELQQKISEIVHEIKCYLECYLQKLENGYSDRAEMEHELKAISDNYRARYTDHEDFSSDMDG
ncbi:hypothetical protein N7522_006385 [Penicillium canescens]|nr:hypothetical protein N7522_006385 [Penicillium canescens]